MIADAKDRPPGKRPSRPRYGENMDIVGEGSEDALSFGQSAALYDRVRPTYPQSAVQWSLQSARPSRLRVVDLGAGTGILTRVLLELGHEVLPVEPDSAMRDQLAKSTPGTEPLCGTAEAMPVRDQSVDAVVVGQAYHWFDRDRAHPEIARVLKPGGVFATMWNERDVGMAWVAELALIANGLAGSRSVPHTEPTGLAPWFHPVEHQTFSHVALHTADSLVELVMSRSYYLTATKRTQDKIVKAVQTLVSDQGTTIELPYVTHAYRTTVRTAS